MRRSGVAEKYVSIVQKCWPSSTRESANHLEDILHFVYYCIYCILLISVCSYCCGVWRCTAVGALISQRKLQRDK